MSNVFFCIVQGCGAGVVPPGNENNQSAGSSAERSIIGIHGSEPSIGGNDGDMDTQNQGEDRQMKAMMTEWLMEQRKMIT